MSSRSNKRQKRYISTPVRTYEVVHNRRRRPHQRLIFCAYSVSVSPWRPVTRWSGNRSMWSLHDQLLGNDDV